MEPANPVKDNEPKELVKLHEVRRQPRQTVIDALEMALTRARSGELQGVILLMNQGDTVSTLRGGLYGYTDMIAAFEDWKFCELAERNLICPNCGHDERSSD